MGPAGGALNVCRQLCPKSTASAPLHPARFVLHTVYTPMLPQVARIIKNFRQSCEALSTSEVSETSEVESASRPTHCHLTQASPSATICQNICSDT